MSDKKKMHLIGNSHLDVVWLWQWQEGMAEIKATYRAALDRMKEFPDFTFTAACGSYYEWIEQSDPAMFEEIRARIAEGRWCVVGGWWLQPDCNLPTGESFARHSLLTQRYFKEKFGVTAQTGYNVDSFGHNANLPMILRNGGLKNYVFMRPMPHEKTLPDDLFRWRSADGSEVMTWRIKYYYNIGSVGNFFEDPIELFHRIEGEVSGDGMAFYGVGNHGGGVTVDLLNKMGSELEDNFFYSTPDRFFAEQEGREMPLVAEDLQFHAKGCYAANSDVKKKNRAAEQALLATERFSVLSGKVMNTPYPAKEMERGWKNVLFHQFHDILDGCSIKEAYDDAAAFYGETMAIAARQQNQAVQQISWNVDTTGDFPYHGALSWAEAERIGAPIVVFNSHPYPVRQAVHLRKLPAEVTDETGAPVPLQVVRDSKNIGIDEKGRCGVIFEAEVPALGWRLYRMRTEVDRHEFDSPFTFTEAGLDNGILRVSFDPKTGELSELTDLRDGRVLVSDSRTRLFDDTPYDTWAHGMNAYETELPCEVSGSVRVIEQGPLRATIRVEQTFGDSRLTRDYSLVAGSDQLQVKVIADYREKLRVLKFGYTADNNAARCQIPFGSVDRTVDGAEHACVGWMSLGGLGLTTDSKYSFSARDNELQLTALRSSTYADHCGQRDEFCEYMDQGDCRFVYTLFPYTSEADAARRTEQLCTPLTAVIETFHKGSLPVVFSGMSLSAENVLVTAVKPSEDGDGVVVRLNETAGRDTVTTLTVFDESYEAVVPAHGVVTLLLRDGKAVSTDFMEWPI